METKPLMHPHGGDLDAIERKYGISKAARPFNSRLDKSKLTENGFSLLPSWQDALARYLKEIEF